MILVMVLEYPNISPNGKILTVAVMCSNKEEAINYKLPLKYTWGYSLVEGVLETIPHNRKFPFYRVIQRNLQKSTIKI
jgi:hypothetical protein